MVVTLVEPKVKGVGREAVPVTVRFGIVTAPVPKVTGLFPIVLKDKVPEPVVSMTGLSAERTMLVPPIVKVPVPTVKGLDPVTVVAPFKETVPVPVEKVLFPVWEKELSKVVAPWRVNVPGVVVEPMVFTEEAPEPMVFVEEEPEPKELVVLVPVPKVELPEEVIVVEAMVEGVVAPIAVLLIPVVVVLKLAEVKVRLFVPVLIDEAPSPSKAKAPELAVIFKAPVVRVKPWEAVRVEEIVAVPLTV